MVYIAGLDGYRSPSIRIKCDTMLLWAMQSASLLLLILTFVHWSVLAYSMVNFILHFHECVHQHRDSPKVVFKERKKPVVHWLDAYSL